MRRLLLAFAGIASLALAGAASAGDESPLPRQEWSFEGPFGTFDRGALQRGFQIYSEVCSQCHSMKLLHYGDLGPDGPGGGIGYTADEVKAIAATPFVNGRQVTDGPNDQGEMYQRPGRPSDAFVAPFDNPQQAAAAYNAVPPDLSLIIKAREGGPDYVYDLLTGYRTEPPPGFAMSSPTLLYNDVFPGHQIAMPQPLDDNRVTYADGTKARLEQEARDVVTFLTWASEPVMEERKHMGTEVMLFLLVMAVAFYGAKRKIWADVH